MKDLLKTADLTPADFNYLLELSAELKADPLKYHGMLTGKTVVLYFEKPSTRTRFSTETAVVRLGGVPLSVSKEELQASRGETLEDTARIVSRYSEAMLVRVFADDDAKLIAESASIPVINGLSDGHHPLQSLADLLTLKEQWGTLAGKTLAYVGASNNVAHSLMEACALTGVNIVIASPEGYQLDSAIIANAKAIAAEQGSTVKMISDPVEAVTGADAVYTDAWISMGDAEAQWANQVAALLPYRVTNELMSKAAPGAPFLHCLPAHRGEEVTAEVIDGPQSVVFDQGENRLPTVQAVLYALLTGKIKGSAQAATETVSNVGVAVPV